MTDLFIRSLFTWRSAVASPFGPKGPTTRHVLLTLALHMNEKGESCFPSIDRISEETGLSRRAVMEHLQKAADAGWLGKRARRHPNGQGWRFMEYLPLLPAGIEDAVKQWDEERREKRSTFHEKQPGDSALPPRKRGDRGAPGERGDFHAKGGDSGAEGGDFHAEGGAPGSPEYFSSTSKSTSGSTSKTRAARATPEAAADPDWLPAEWQEFERHRREKRQTLTPTARTGCIRKLARWREASRDIVAILRYSIDNGYTGLFEPHERPARRSPGSNARQVAADWARDTEVKEEVVEGK